MTILYTYAGSGYIPGIPAKDITKEEFDKLTASQKIAISGKPELYTLAQSKKKTRKPDTAVETKSGQE
ncbi:hypothetical protein KDA23_06055 [Candidatus Saccharibacteria bacterium]|nr:hypothetical protein [Candidatus Saccharibacteria bacterium]